MIKIFSILLLFCELTYGGFNKILAQPTTVWVSADNSFNSFKAIASTIVVTANPFSFNKWRMEVTSITLSDGSPFDPNPPTSHILDNATAYWKFNEGTGTNVNDEIGTNDLTVSGDVAWLTGGAFGGNCLNSIFQNTAKIISGSAVNVTPPFSISLWLYVITQATADGYFQGCGSYPDSTTPGYLLYFTGYASGLPHDVKCAIWQGGAYHDVTTSSKCVTENQWNNIIWVQEFGTATVYVNGQLIQTMALNYTPDNGNNISISSAYGQGAPWFWNTKVNDVCIWCPRALTQTDVTEINTKGHSMP